MLQAIFIKMDNTDKRHSKEFREFQRERMIKYLAENPHPAEGRPRSEEVKAQQSKKMKEY